MSGSPMQRSMKSSSLSPAVASGSASPSRGDGERQRAPAALTGATGDCAPVDVGARWDPRFDERLGIAGHSDKRQFDQLLFVKVDARKPVVAATLLVLCEVPFERAEADRRRRQPAILGEVVDIV